MTEIKLEGLKPFDQLCEADSRQLGWRIKNHDTGDVRDRTLEEYHRGISRIQLDAHVPEAVRQHFDVARNVLIYAWFVYGFVPIAELQVFATLEFALRLRLGREHEKRPPGLAELLKQAVDMGVLCDDDFAALRTIPGQPVVTGNSIVDANLRSADHRSAESHIALMARAIPRLRNLLAHGAFALWPGGQGAFIVVSTAINALYRQSRSELDAPSTG